MDTSSTAAASRYRPAVSSDFHFLLSTGDSVMNAPDRFFLPAIQARADQRQLAIQKVGVKGLRYPLALLDADGKVQNTVARLSLSVALPAEVKGTHMSRFVEILNVPGREISVDSFRDMLTEMTERLEAEAGHIEMTFMYFVTKAAPVSAVRSLMDYEVTFIGEIRDSRPTMNVKVVVPVTSLCPCSKKISKYGAHNQRSHVTVNVRVQNFIWIEDIIDLVEKEASCELYGLLKRPDEKYVTERAYDNPKFVEDMVRDIAAKLNRDERVAAYAVESENFESIHNHSAYAMIERDKDAGETAAP